MISLYLHNCDRSVFTKLKHHIQFLSKEVKMGSSHSYPGLTEDLMEEYTMLTYLSKGEILYLMKKFYSIDPEKVTADYHHRFSKEDILKHFDVLRNNPFQDRMFKVFSSKRDDCFSFEDMVDMYSAMSSECPADVKAEWAFRVFDLDDDNQISAKDICGIIDRLTVVSNKDTGRIEFPLKKKIAHVILEELALDITGSICVSEFKIMMSRFPDFPSSFYFKL